MRGSAVRETTRIATPAPSAGQNRSVRLCACASVWKYPFEAVLSIFDFDETIQGIVHEIKYGARNGWRTTWERLRQTCSGLFF